MRWRGTAGASHSVFKHTAFLLAWSGSRTDWRRCLRPPLDTTCRSPCDGTGRGGGTILHGHLNSSQVYELSKALTELQRPFPPLASQRLGSLKVIQDPNQLAAHLRPSVANVEVVSFHCVSNRDSRSGSTATPRHASLSSVLQYSASAVTG